MQLISVNIGHEQPIQFPRHLENTGIFKLPVDHPVEITPLGLVGDSVTDKKHHGGPDQAVYVYTAEDYYYWSGALEKLVPPGTFGDNLTIRGLLSAACAVGDRLEIGGVILEVTAPRIPCGTLAARMGDPAFIKRFRQAERPGLYCRVIQPGFVSVGAEVSYKPYQGEGVQVLELFRSFYEPELAEATLRRQLKAPISIRAREEKEARLKKLTG